MKLNRYLMYKINIFLVLILSSSSFASFGNESNVSSKSLSNANVDYIYFGSNYMYGFLLISGYPELAHFFESNTMKSIGTLGGWPDGTPGGSQENRTISGESSSGSSKSRTTLGGWPDGSQNSN